MPLLQWTEDYVTGIMAADYEHRTLIRDINQFHDEWSRRSGAGTDEFFADVLKRLGRHFVIEEGVMAESAYAGIDAHRADHELLLRQLRDIRREAVERHRDFAGPLAELLERWLASHIQGHDAEMYRTLGLGH
ncbi:MAG: bacteriohemerythrin [Bradyrhizobium sp.]